MKRIIVSVLIAIFVITGIVGCGSAEAKGIGKRVIYLTVGETANMEAQLKGAIENELTWTVSDSNVIQAQGTKITAVGSGLAKAVATVGGKSMTIGVVSLPESVSVSVGETFQLPCGLSEKYISKDKKIARVSKKGVVYGFAAGTTTVQVRYKNQLKTITVQVEDNRTENNFGSSEQSKAAKLECAATANQIVFVEYKGGSNATVSIHEKQNGIWTELGSCEGYVGKNGIGKTKEGDKKTPQGTYNLTTPFGIKADPGSKLPYTKVTKYHYWCGRSASEYYNQLVDTRVTGTKVTSSDEYLINYKGVYNYCMFIDYNREGVAHKGSCIFLHCKGRNKYTAGCIAVDESFMKKIIQWADNGCKIVIQ